MAKLICEISEGLRESEVCAIVSDVYKRKHYLRVEHDFLYTIEKKKYLPVCIVHKGDHILIEFPQEAETGANRIWVNSEQLIME